MQKWTGERLETFVVNESMIEHLHRYAIAMEYVNDKVVLDIACGEGYGSNLLSKHAREVTGIDMDGKTISHASKKYSKNNLKFIEGKVEDIPVPDNSFDVVISFETLEHTHEHEKVFGEIKRVLRPGGLLIISTPEKKHYSDLPDYQNPFHLKEVYENEFIDLLKNYFPHHYVFHQSSGFSSVILQAKATKLKVYSGSYEDVHDVANIVPLYLMAIASDKEIDTPTSSIFLGAAIFQSALSEKEKEMRNTISYRTGHFLLLPFKWLWSAFRKKSHSNHD